jgi:hypothetical protein
MSRQIPLAKGRSALVDDDDFARVSEYQWHITSSGYVAGMVLIDGAQKLVYLHRFLLDAPPSQVVDHINGDRLDNQRDNLRLVTRAQNQWNRKVQRNRSGYKGVSWHRRKRKFYARIQANGQRYHLGYFDTAEEAAQAYDDAARLLFGEYARLNGVNSAASAEAVSSRHGAEEEEDAV